LSDRGRLIVFAAPAGGGKSTVIGKLREHHPDWGFSISATTRPPRPTEQDGREYYFLSRDEFLRRVERAEFLEHEEVHGNLYGTLKQPTIERIQRGETIIFDVDVKGALSVKAAYPDALAIFLLPPSREILRSRLENRKTEAPESIKRRLARADMELGLAERFDARIVNDDLDTAVRDVEEAIAAWPNNKTRR